MEQRGTFGTISDDGGTDLSTCTGDIEDFEAASVPQDEQARGEAIASLDCMSIGVCGMRGA